MSVHLMWVLAKLGIEALHLPQEDVFLEVLGNCSDLVCSDCCFCGRGLRDGVSDSWHPEERQWG